MRILIIGLALLLILPSGRAAQAQLSDLSRSLKKLEKPKNMSSKKTYKAAVVRNRSKSSRHRKSDKLASAVLWHAPPYRQMTQRLSLEEELVRDLQAIEILSNGAAQNYQPIKKAKKILSKNKTVFGSLTQAFLKEVNAMTVNIDFSQLGKVSSKEDAQSMIDRLNHYLYSNFKVYKQKYFVNDMRNPKFIKKIEIARSKLLIVSGEESLLEVDKLYLGDF